jgi:hypothetical protein
MAVHPTEHNRDRVGPHGLPPPTPPDVTHPLHRFRRPFGRSPDISSSDDTLCWLSPCARMPHDFFGQLPEGCRPVPATWQISRGKLHHLPRRATRLAKRPLGWKTSWCRAHSSQGASRLLSGACPSARAFAPHCLQTPSRDDALALRYPFASIQQGRRFVQPTPRRWPRRSRR